MMASGFAGWLTSGSGGGGVVHRGRIGTDGGLSVVASISRGADRIATGIAGAARGIGGCACAVVKVTPATVIEAAAIGNCATIVKTTTAAPRSSEACASRSTAAWAAIAWTTATTAPAVATPAVAGSGGAVIGEGIGVGEGVVVKTVIVIEAVVIVKAVVVIEGVWVIKPVVVQARGIVEKGGAIVKSIGAVPIGSGVIAGDSGDGGDGGGELTNTHPASQKAGSSDDGAKDDIEGRFGGFHGWGWVNALELAAG